MVERLIGYFYPVPGASESERERASMLVVGALIGVVLSVLSALAYIPLGEQQQLPANIVGTAYCLVVLFALRLTRSIDFATNLTAVSMMVVYPASALAQHDLTQLAWMGLVPIAVLLLGKLRHAVGWFVAASLLGPGVALWLAREPEAIVVVPPEGLVLRAMIFLSAVFTLTVAFAVGRARTQRRLEEARDEANRANRLKSEFLANFSHEIRTPLNGVIGTADLLLSGQLPDDVRQQLLIIQRSGSNLLRTINDVLELSRIEAGRLDLFPIATDVPRLLRDAVDLFQARAQQQGLSLTLELEPDHPVHVLVDDLRLRQVVQNLIGNAIKFTARGHITVRLATGQRSGEQVRTRISVTDTGPGIAPEAAAKLFNAFTQARVEHDRNEGSGLGLALCKQFVELMGGTLTLDSALGRGSTFTVELNPPLATAVAPETKPAPVAAPPAQRLKVLVVDDNEINLRVASSLLTRLGHEVSVARDGERGLAAIQEQQPDVVFMDCHMPGLDGLEATRKLRASGDGRPVVALTASVYAEDRARCQAAGMNDFVSKPVTLASLQAALDQVAGARPPTAAPEPRRALVVDDDPHVRRMTVRLLRAEGFEVSDAADIEEATLLYQRAHPSLVVVDHVLGGAEDGMHFAQRLCREDAQLHVVVTSGQAPTQEQLSTLHAAGGHFLAKPYNRRNLMELLRAERAH